MAVAVWDHAPSEEELLRARVDGGWWPTATATRGGEIVMGYAARLLADDDDAGTSGG